MNERDNNEKMATDDIFFSVVLFGIGLYSSFVNVQESDYIGLFGTLLIVLFAGLWFGARVYHLTHKSEVMK